MVSASSVVAVGPLQARLGHVAGYLYLHEAEISPIAPADNAGDDEWERYDAAFLAFQSPTNCSSGYPGLERTQRLLEGVGSILLALRELIQTNWTEEAIQFEFYEAAKSHFGTEKAEIREFFRLLYQLVNQTPNGPRWGQFVMIYGYDQFVALLERRFTEPVGLPR